MTKKQCQKCSGKGVIFTFSHVKGGVCFSCNGTGIKTVMKRKKVTFMTHRVSCEGTDYGFINDESEANELASQVQPMHLDAVKVECVESYTYEFTKVAA